MPSFESEGLDKQPWHARTGLLMVWNEGALVIEAHASSLERRQRKSGGDGGSRRKVHGDYCKSWYFAMVWGWRCSTQSHDHRVLLIHFRIRIPPLRVHHDNNRHVFL